ncbi:MAG: DUF2721 domain-containing protein [Chlorobiaceae bacterium]|nr:DUF2721 domain-containing protein [Chlorobiaceae bacterium]
MSIHTFREIVPVLQTSIGPMILISGLGLLLLTMTNRLGRIIDRSRALLDDLESKPEQYVLRINREVAILWKRARYIRTAILLACMTCFGASVLIILLFFSALADFDFPMVIAAIFTASMFCLSGTLVFFFADINLSLEAFRIEMESHDRKKLIMERQDTWII